MKKEIVLSLINALRTLNKVTSQKDEILRNHSLFFSNLISKWFNSHNRLLTVIINEISLKDTGEELKKLVEEGLELEKKIHIYVEELQLDQKDLREKELEFDFILKEIKKELK